MTSKKAKSYQERLKRMKKSIDANKETLEAEFPDDVTIIGNPDLVRKSEEELEDAEEKQKKET